MKRYSFAAGLALAVVVVLRTAGPVAAGEQVPFKGSFEGEDIGTPLVPPIASVVVTATGNATHLGTFAYTALITVNTATGMGSGDFQFTAANGDRAIVFWSCQSGACDRSIAYGAYGLQSAEYALQVNAPGEPSSLGSPSPTLTAAIACARAHDERVRGKAAQELKKQTGR